MIACGAVCERACGYLPASVDRAPGVAARVDGGGGAHGGAAGALGVGAAARDAEGTEPQ